MEKLHNYKKKSSCINLKVKKKLGSSQGIVCEDRCQNQMNNISPEMNATTERKLYYKAYKSAPACITKILQEMNFELTKSVKKSDLIWKLYQNEKMSKLIQSLSPNQKYNHFPKTFQIGRKDNLWRNYLKFRKEFGSSDFNYMPQTYLLPKDYEEIKTLITNKPNNKYIIKPVASSRGRGVKLLSNGLKELNHLCEKSQKKHNEYLISKYIDKPHLINNKKYDLRIYVLVLSYSPIKIYIFNEGLVRFASEEYVNDKVNKENIYIHLTNYALNKNNTDKVEDIKWNLKMYEDYFIKNNLQEEHSNIWKKIKDIIVKTIITISDQSQLAVKVLTKSRNNLFEVYGFDILMDEQYSPYLCEVNVSPSLNCDSEIDMQVKSSLIREVINIIGVGKNNYECEEKVQSILSPRRIAKSTTESLPNINNIILPDNLHKNKETSKGKISICKVFNSVNPNFNLINLDFNNSDIIYQNMISLYNEELQRSLIKNQLRLLYPTKENYTEYIKFVKNPGDENIILWKYLSTC